MWLIQAKETVIKNYGLESVTTIGADEEDAASALLEYEIQEGAVGMELGFFI